MRKIIILLITLSACGETNRTVQQQIFDDYLLIHFNSWSKAMGKNYVQEFYYEPGDTVRLRSKLSMLIIPDDTTAEIPLSPENALNLDSGTLINITSEEKKFTFEVEVDIQDSTYMGIIWTDHFLDAQWGKDELNRNRKGLTEQLVRLKKEGLSELSTKYKLSEDSILVLISYEYYERTGRIGINY